MEKKQRQRKKGGGRKLADGKISKRTLKKNVLNWFKYRCEYSVQKFIVKHKISRQTYYRFLASDPAFRKEVYTKRIEAIKSQKEMRRKLFLWLRDNPDKHMMDYFLKDLSSPEINLPPLATTL
jgi:hypothetical protein